MKTKIVYVLVSSPKDLYLEMAYVSMCSVKHHNPDATIVLVVDSATNASFTSTRASFSNKADEICSRNKRTEFSSATRRIYIR